MPPSASEREGGPNFELEAVTYVTRKNARRSSELPEGGLPHLRHRPMVPSSGQVDVVADFQACPVRRGLECEADSL